MATNVTYPYGYYYYYPPGPEKYADVERSITRTRSSLMRHRCMDALSSSSSFVAVVAVVAMTVKIVAVLPVVSVAV